MLKKQLIFTMFFALIAISGRQIQAAAAPSQTMTREELIFDNPNLMPTQKDYENSFRPQDRFTCLYYSCRVAIPGISESDRKRINWIINNWNEYWNIIISEQQQPQPRD